MPVKKKISISDRLISASLFPAGFAATAFAQTDFWEPVKGNLAGPVTAMAIDKNEFISAGIFSGIARAADNGVGRRRLEEVSCHS
ncbi:hypothetical protein HUU05_05450 [candidate division KSB1 bacterium]|nr:hypothetical protein [candidate division KSB1 bacterium]